MLEYNAMYQTFSALAEPNRLRIVACLGNGAKSVGDIASVLNLNQPQTSKHLAVLKAANLVDVERKAQQRLYALCPSGLRDLNHWLESYRHIWDARLDQLDDVIADMVKEESAPNGTK
jgi:DNA-binding transcriptional ArsR family regulator